MFDNLEKVLKGASEELVDLREENNRIKVQNKKLRYHKSINVQTIQDLNIIISTCRMAGWKSNRNKFNLTGYDIANFVKQLKAQFEAAEEVIKETKNDVKSVEDSQYCGRHELALERIDDTIEEYNILKGEEINE